MIECNHPNKKTEENTMMERKKIRTEVLVIGSGPAGISAAYTAAKNGVKTIIVEQCGDLGGIATTGLMSHWTGSCDSPAYHEILRRSAQRNDGDMKGKITIQIDPEKLISINDKYACWIYSADTPIDYPIVHGPDNQKWLHSLFDGSWNSAGTLFIDYRNLGAFQDPNTIIYGHHMRNDSMFGTLTEYEDQAYYEAHPWLLLIEADRISVVQLLAGYTTSKYDHCYDIAISDEDDLNAFVEEAMEKSDFVSDVTVEAGEALATLSTCAYVFDNARYIVIGKLTPVCETDCAEAAAPAE